MFIIYKYSHIIRCYNRGAAECLNSIIQGNLTCISNLITVLYLMILSIIHKNYC